jgi:hypothetical protein
MKIRKFQGIFRALGNHPAAGKKMQFAADGKAACTACIDLALQRQAPREAPGLLERPFRLHRRISKFKSSDLS